jgi:glycosyltransferase involved in cell wall biosynthesis
MRSYPDQSTVEPPYDSTSLPLEHEAVDSPGRRAKVAFVYPNSRLQLAADVAAGTGADSSLLGQNHLARFGYHAFIHEPRLEAVSEVGGLAHRVRWNIREALIPWELGDADLVVSSLANLLPAAARLRGRPRVVLLDFALATVLDRRRGAGRGMLLRSLRSADAIVCLSETQQARLLERVTIAPERIHTVLLGVDHAFLRPTARGTDENGFVLAVGKDLARDYRSLTQAAAELPTKLVIVCEDRNVRGLDLPHNVEIRRGLTFHELRDLYARAGCVVLPVRRPDYPYGTEGSGLTALTEAMAMAKAIIVSDRPIFHEYVQAEESAIFVPPEDPSALKGAIDRVLSDDQLAQALGRAARNRIEERHTMQRFAEGLAGIFDQLLQLDG